ncbi:hypothetical protein [Alloalcanivorax marinus]|uniref:hypothetical protein n=1 Tax=Alloalcanivorax marinus TaxID=1177169 RepID=UPI001A501240|nr:hypothetical protein [Alloalcanivorax marinus]MBL7250521.1 hypothetical protein [Alloalcanivorax marinus]
MASLGRWLALSVIGGVALLLAVARWGEPARAEERGGWLYRQFGDQGVVLGMLAMGLLFLVLGLIGMFRSGRALWRYRQAGSSPDPLQAATPGGVRLAGWLFLLAGAIWTLFYMGGKARALAAGAASVEYAYPAVLIGPLAVALGLFYLLVRPGTLQGVQAMSPRERAWFLVFLVAGVLAGVGLGVGLPAWAPLLAGGG